MSSNDKNIRIGLKFRELRQHSGMTIEEFADKTKISATHLINIESGKESITDGDLKKISSILVVIPEHIRPEQFAADKLADILEDEVPVVF